jgi:cytochrome P450
MNGSHACIGYRFALLEMKIVLHVLLSAFDFGLAVKPEEIGKQGTGILMRPCLKSEREKGGTLPLLMKVVNAQE